MQTTSGGNAIASLAVSNGNVIAYQTKISAGGGVPSDYLATDSFTSSSTTIPSENIGWITINVAKNGYTPIGILGINCYSHTKGSGTEDYGRAISIHAFNLNGTTVTIGINNRGGSTCSTRYTANVLYRKN